MELVSLVKEMLQSGAERAASYQFGQTVLQYMDRALWVVEKCARWAVPPPLDQDERPQPELVRPLPWVFFLMMLVLLRVARESISLLNLVMGKPPLRSADVVMFMQCKRRQLRALQYAGTRIARARPPPAAWPALADMLRLSMCFRRHPPHANNNTTQVVKRSKRGREKSSPVVSGTESTMERLIEKMMVDLDADSDEDSSFTLTNLTSPKSDRSECTVESEQDSFHNDTQTTQEPPVKPQEQPQATQNETEYCNVETPTNEMDTQSQENRLPTQNDIHPRRELNTTKNEPQPQKEVLTTQNEKRPKKEVPNIQNETQPQKELPIKHDEQQPKKKVPTTQNETHPQNEVPTTQNKTQPQSEVLTTQNEKRPKKEVPNIQNETQPQSEVPTTQNETQPKKVVPTTPNETQPQIDISIAPNTQQSQKEVPTTENKTQTRKELKNTLNNTEYECENNEKKEELEYEDCECNEIPKELFSTPDLPTLMSPKEESQQFLQMEATSKIPRTSNNEQKIANGRTAKSVPSKKKGAHAHEKHRRNSERASKRVSTDDSV